MATKPQHIDVLRMPWDELMRRVAEVAAGGSQRARAQLRMLVDEEDRARQEGREPGGVIARLATLAVLRSIHDAPMGRKETDDD